MNTPAGDCWQSQKPAKKSNSFLKGLFVKGPVDMVKSLFTLKGAAMAIGGLIACIAFPVAAPLALSALAIGAGGYQMYRGFSKGDKTQAGVGAFTALTGIAGGLFGCKKPTVCDEMPVYHNQKGYALLDDEGVPLGGDHVFRHPETGSNDVIWVKRDGEFVPLEREHIVQYHHPSFTSRGGEVYPPEGRVYPKGDLETGEPINLQEKYPHLDFTKFESVESGHPSKIFKGKDGNTLVDEEYGDPIAEQFVYQHPETKQNEVFTDADGNQTFTPRKFLKYNAETKQVERNSDPENPRKLLEVPEEDQPPPGTPMGDSVSERLNIQPKRNLQNAFETLRQGNTIYPIKGRIISSDSRQ